MAFDTIKGLHVKIGGDTTELGKALEDVNKKSRSLSGELGEVNRLLKMDPGNADLLAQKQKILTEAVENTSKKLKTLREAEKQVQEQFAKGKASADQVRALQREIIATEKKMDKYNQAAKETEDALNGVSKESKEVAEHSGKLGQALGTAAKVGMAAVAAAATAAVAGLVAAAESTREYRTEMGKLDAAFTASGLSTGAASAAYKELIGVIGETDQSVEAAQQIALLADSEEDVANWASLASGVVGQFGDALQPETFFEAANETMKLGEATGAYTQMLEGCGLSVEEFNEGLAACKTEQEKQAYMLQVTEGALGKAGEAYEKNNKDIIESNQATAAWMESLSGIGGAIEPIITDVKMMGASLLSDLVPGVQQMAEAFRGMMSGDAGAADQFGAALSGMVTGLVEKLTTALPTIMQVGGSMISTLVQSLLQQIPTLLQTGGQIVGQLLSGIATALPGLLQSAVNLMSNFAAGLKTQLPVILQQGSEMLMNLVTGIANSLPSLVDQALDALMSFATTLYDNAPTLINTGFDMLSKLVSGILSCLPSLLSKAPEIISKFANIINDNFPTILKKGFELIVQIIKGIISAIPDLVKNIPKIVTAIVDVIEAFNWLNLGKKILTFFKDGIVSMFGHIKTAGKGVLDNITNVLKNLPDNLMRLGKTAIDDLAGALRNGWNTVKSGAKAIFDGLVGFFKGLPDKMLSIGKDLVRGLWNGISDMTGWVIDKIEGFGDKVLGGIKDFFGIKSPSRVFRDEVGKMLAMGMAEGIADSADVPIKAMQKMAGGVLDEANGMNGLTLERTINHRISASQAAAAAADNTALLSKLEGIYERLGRLQIVLDTGTLVGETLDKIDAGLAGRQLLSARGV